MIKSINFVELGNTLCEYDYVEVAYNGSNICKSYDVYARQGDKVHLIVYTGLKECD